MHSDLTGYPEGSGRWSRSLSLYCDPPQLLMSRSPSDDALQALQIARSRLTASQYLSRKPRWAVFTGFGSYVHGFHLLT